MWPYPRWPLTENLLGLHHLFLPQEHLLKQAVKFLFPLFAIISWRSVAITREQISTKSWFNKKANNHKQQYPSWDLQGCGPQCTGGFPWCSAKHMEQRGHAWRLLQCSHCYSLQQQGEQVQLWKLQRHLTSFRSGNCHYSHSSETTDHGNWKRSPRGAVWLQTRMQHRGHDFVLRQVQEKCFEQSKALFSVFINLTKVFNTVNREALWMVLERYGNPKKFVRLIQLLHDGMTGQLSLCSRD